jgi:hypothetical protein
MRLEINLEVGNQLGMPLTKILIDDYIVLYEGPAIETFDRTFEIDTGEHELKIVHFGKIDNDHVYNPDGSIAIDKYVYIKNISIDQVRLTEQELQTGQFWPVYSMSYVNTMVEKQQDLPSYISPNLYIGHNGTWKYTFFNPFVDWIISCRKPGPKLENTIFKTSQCLLNEAKQFFTDAPDF